MCLITGATPPASNPLAKAWPRAATLVGLVRPGAGADDGVGAALGDVEDGRAVNRDSDFVKVVRDEPADQAAPRPPPLPRAMRGDSSSGGISSAIPAGPSAVPGRPPDRSILARRRARRRARNAAVSARSWPRSATLRLNRIGPTGRRRGRTRPRPSSSAEAGASCNEGSGHSNSVAIDRSFCAADHFATKHSPPFPFSRAQSAAASALLRPTTRTR